MGAHFGYDIELRIKSRGGEHRVGVEVIDVPEGQHGFDILDYTDSSRAAVTRANGMGHRDVATVTENVSLSTL